MKKILALLLALVLAAAVSLAGAETLEIVPGSPTGCDVNTFKMYFTVLTAESGYTFTFDNDLTQDGIYSVYTAHASEFDMTLKLYALNTMLVYAEGSGEVTANASDTDTANRFGELFGTALGGMILSAYVGEGNNFDESVLNTYTNELMPLLTILSDGLDNEAKLADGVVGLVNVLGYPTGMELRGSASGSIANLMIHFVLASPDAQLIQK